MFVPRPIADLTKLVLANNKYTFVILTVPGLYDFLKSYPNNIPARYARKFDTADIGRYKFNIGNLIAEKDSSFFYETNLRLITPNNVCIPLLYGFDALQVFINYTAQDLTINQSNFTVFSQQPTNGQLAITVKEVYNYAMTQFMYYWISFAQTIQVDPFVSHKIIHPLYGYVTVAILSPDLRNIQVAFTFYNCVPAENTVSKILNLDIYNPELVRFDILLNFQSYGVFFNQPLSESVSFENVDIYEKVTQTVLSWFDSDILTGSE